LFWLYASIHIRDAAVLLATTCLTLVWVHFLAKPGMRNGILLALATMFALAGFGLLRTELIYVPIAMLGAGMASLAFTSSHGGKLLTALTLACVLAILVDPSLSDRWRGEAIESADVNSLGYGELSYQESQSGSLGSSLIMAQPLPARILLGSGYVLVFPIPWWSGFQQNSAYHVYKSLHVLFMYAVIPLFSLALWRVAHTRSLRSPQIAFLVLMVIGPLASVSYTSLETRHFGAFLVSLLVLSVLPDLSRKADWRSYQLLVSCFVAMIGALHIAWAAIK
jgi:hypothetical protein